MDIHSVLSSLGLSEGEIKVYVALLKLGSSPVSKVKEETSLHRTTIYDFVEKLLNKGLINYVVKSGVKYYSAAAPQKLQDFLVEKQRQLQEVLPELDKLAKFHKQDIKVEVYKGREGLKTVMLEAIREGKETIGIGIDDGLWKRELPVFIEQYQRMLEEKGMKERILTRANADYYFHTKQTQYKFIPEEYFSPLSTLVYGNKVQIVIWEPSLTTIFIESKKLADSYRTHFDTLWNQASMMFRGEAEINNLFMEIGNTIEGEYFVFGAPSIADKYTPIFKKTMDLFQQRKIKSKAIFDELARDQIDLCKKYPNIKYKTLPRNYMSPAEVSIYNTKVAIIVWEGTPQAFVIDNKNVADSFRTYFKLLWKMAQ